MDCISVSCTPVKAAIDDQIQRLFDALLFSLRRSVLDDVNTMNKFLDESMLVLAVRPQSVEEMGEASAQYEEIKKKKNDVSLFLFLCSCGGSL